MCRPEGTIAFVVTGRREAVDLEVEDCAESINPDDILKGITIRDPDGAEVARVTVRGRDASVKLVGAYQ